MVDEDAKDAAGVPKGYSLHIDEVDILLDHICNRLFSVFLI